MAGGVRICAGTRTGLQLVDLSHGEPEVFGVAHHGEIIQVVTGSPGKLRNLYVGLADGLHKSEDGGTTWRRTLEGDVRSITVDPSDECVIYAGTDPVHLYRSEDAGESWEELISLQRLPQETHEKLGEFSPNDMSRNQEASFRHRRQEWWIHPPYKGHVLYIFVHPDNPNYLMLCLEHGGIALSTDRGESWEDASEGIDYLDIHYLTNMPQHFDRFLVTSARGLFETSDPRLGWTRAEEGCDRDYFHDLAILPSTDGGDPVTLVATAEGSPGVWRRAARGSRAAVYRSHDFGKSWERVGASNGLPEDMAAMVWAFGPHPSEPATVIAAIGESSAVPSPERGIGSGSLVMTTDAGGSWRTLLDTPSAVEHLFVAAR